MKSSDGESFNKNRWIIQTKEVIEMENDDPESERLVSIFNVPAQLLTIKLEAYTPQKISIGPYHFRNPDLNEMEQFKLQCASRMQRSFTKETSFGDVSRKFAENEHRIKSCYNRSLDYWSGTTIAWMILLDVCFFPEYIHYFAVNPLERSQSKLSPARLDLINYAGKKAAQQFILRDIMLENLIPLFLLHLLLEMQSGSSAEARLKAILRGHCREVSPFKSVQCLPEFQITKRSHLLEIFYYTIIPPKEIPPEIADDHKKDDVVPNSNVLNTKKKKKLVKDIKKCATS